MELPQRVALMAHVTVLTDRPATARLNGYQKPTDHGRTDGGWEAATDHGPFVSRTSKAPARQPANGSTNRGTDPRHERLAHGARNHEPAHAMLNICDLARGRSAPPLRSPRRPALRRSSRAGDSPSNAS